MELIKSLLNNCLIIIIITKLCSCDFLDNKLKICNNSNDSIAFIVQTDTTKFPVSRWNAGLRENDSLLNSYAKYIPESQSSVGIEFLSPDSCQRLMTFNTYWEAKIEQSPKKKLEIFFFQPDIITSGKYTWEEIWSKHLYVQKREFTKEELSRANWTIFYKQ